MKIGLKKLLCIAVINLRKIKSTGNEDLGHPINYKLPSFQDTFNPTCRMVSYQRHSVDQSQESSITHIVENSNSHKMTIPNVHNTKYLAVSCLVFDKSDVFVNKISELLAFILLYRVDFVNLITYFLAKKKLIRVDDETQSKPSLVELLKIGFEFFEKDKIFNYMEEIKNYETKKKEKAKLYKRNYREKQKLMNSGLLTSNEITKQHYSATRRRLPASLIFFNQKYRLFFNYLDNKDSLYFVFLTYVSLLFKCTDYYNEHLNSSFQLYLTTPPALFSAKVSYCLDQIDVQSDPNALAFYISDFFTYYISLEDMSKLSFPKCLQPDSYMTKFMIVMYYVFQNTLVLNPFLHHNPFFTSWLTCYSDLACKDEENYKKFNEFIKRAKSYSDIHVLKHKYHKRRANIIQLHEHPAFEIVLDDVLTFFQFCHLLIHEALLKTIQLTNHQS